MTTEDKLIRSIVAPEPALTSFSYLANRLEEVLDFPIRLILLSIKILFSVVVEGQILKLWLSALTPLTRISRVILHLSVISAMPR
jgi:hypothetical protein